MQWGLSSFFFTILNYNNSYIHFRLFDEFEVLRNGLLNSTSLGPNVSHTFKQETSSERVGDSHERFLVRIFLYTCFFLKHVFKVLSNFHYSPNFLSFFFFSHALCIITTKSGLFSIPLSEGRKSVFYHRRACLDHLKLPLTFPKALPMHLDFGFL